MLPGEYLVLAALFVALVVAGAIASSTSVAQLWRGVAIVVAGALWLALIVAVVVLLRISNV